MGVFKQTIAQLQAIFDKAANMLVTTDVVNNLESDATDKPLSAAQGKALKASIPEVYSLPAATTKAIGGVKQCAAVTDATNAEDVVATVNKILAEMRKSGQMAG